MKLNCTICDKEKEIRPYRKDTFRFCSTECKSKSMAGKKPWNYGKKYTKKQKSRLNTDGLKIGRHKRYHQCLAKTYGAIHYWIRKKRGIPSWCEHCGKTDGRFEWANVDHLYNKNPNDYLSLCCKCHFKYDTDGGLREFAINPRAKK